jgi:hypothetical protein
MLRIIVELVPGGRELAKFELARAELGNVSDLAAVSNYVIRAGEGANPLAGTPAWQRTGKIEDHRRDQSVWALVERAAAWCGDEAAKASSFG